MDQPIKPYFRSSFTANRISFGYGASNFFNLSFLGSVKVSAYAFRPDLSKSGRSGLAFFSVITFYIREIQRCPIPIKYIRDDRDTGRAQMGANLVRSTGGWSGLDQRVSFKSLKHPYLLNRSLALLVINQRSMLSVPAN